jgi:hypothetical protein
MTGQTHYFRTMAIHPTGWGFGWVFCEGPFKLLGAGFFRPIRGRLRLASVRKFERLLAKYQPGEPVLESFDHRRKSGEKLGLYLLSVATEHALTVTGHRRDQIQAAFADVGAKTREDLTGAVVRHFPCLGSRLPKRHRPWDGEDRRLAIFNAAAVIVAHFQNGATALLNDLRDAA